MRNLFCLSSAIFAICVGLTRANTFRLMDSNDIFRNKVDEILTKNTTKNVLFSSLSLHTALSVLLLGAREKTRNLLVKVMNLEEPSETADDYGALFKDMKSITEVTMDIGTKLFLSKAHPAGNRFKDLSHRYYSSEVENVDFTNAYNARAKIRNWVTYKTKDIPKEIIDPTFIDNKTDLILISTVYFKGNWMYPFKPSLLDRFYVSEETYVHCEMMSIHMDIGFLDDEELDAKILRIPYEKYEVALIIVLPNKRMGYVEVEKKLQKIDSFPFKYLLRQYGRAVLPKFQIEKVIDLMEPLSKLGLDKIFSDDAELSDIMDDVPPSVLKVNKFIQKLSFKVDLNGTEAPPIDAPNMSPQHHYANYAFIADHPFLFFLEYNTVNSHHILLHGRVTEV